MACLNIHQHLTCDTSIMLWVHWFNYKFVLKKLLSIQWMIQHPEKCCCKAEIHYGCSNTSLILGVQGHEKGLKTVRFWIIQFFQCTVASYVVGWSPDVMLWAMIFFYLVNLEGSLVVLICECTVLHNSIQSTSKWKPADSNSHLWNLNHSSLFRKIRLPWLLFQGCPVFTKLCVYMNYPENCIILCFELLSF